MSLAAYRQTLERLDAPKDVCKEWRNRVRAHRKRLEELFKVQKPPSDACDAESKLSEDMGQWVVAGESYPNYGLNAGYALEIDSTTQAQGKATYDGLSGFSHPSVVFSREHSTIDGHGRVTYTYLLSDLEKSVRHAAFGLLDAFRYWSTYFGANPEGVQERVDHLGDRMERSRSSTR